MKLRLQYNDVNHRPVAAAFIQGNSVYDWLQAIDKWDTAIENLECYILPSSITNPAPSGLFVIFTDQISSTQLPLLDPYIEVAKGIYIPSYSSLLPVVTENELRKTCLWEVQVFHPSIGLLGFEKKDRIDLADLVDQGSPLNNDWSFAHPGIPGKPPFAEIIVLQPAVNDIIDDFKKDIDTKPLSDIKKNQNNGPLQKIGDEIKWWAFLLLRSVTGLFGATASETSGSNKGTKSSRTYEKIQQWINRNIEDLQKKRDSELNRLLKLFDEDTDEALQYAIPLDSPYLDRGRSAPSDTLTRRPFNFNLGKLGGGSVGDVWNVGDHYSDLRRKYTRAAQTAIEKRDFRKAAYVYAHLLGDYHGAANALEQGKYYREAAALYKDHLKNITAAAQCLEKGGLYLESIELYKQLNQPEKIGDLYDMISRKADAKIYYEQAIEIKLENNDYLDAGRLVDNKLRDKERAKQILLNGWNNERQSENCLKNYFDLIRETENENIEQKVRDVYKNHTPKQRKKKLLEVLKHVYSRKKDIKEADYYQHIAYEIASEQAEERNLYILNELSYFFPEDEFIAADCNRYIHDRPDRLREKIDTKAFHLDASIKWRRATWHRNQFLAAGVKNGVLHLARCNWHGNSEYYSWTNEVESNNFFYFANAPFHNNNIILYSSNSMPVTRKNLEKNKYFQDALVVYCPVWLHKRKTQFTISEQNEIVLLDSDNGKATLCYYHLDGELKRTHHCNTGNNAGFSLPLGNSLLVNRDNFHYTHFSKQFYIIDENGRTSIFPFDSIIRNFGISRLYADPWLIISSNKGCILCKPSDGKLNVMSPLFASELTPAFIEFISSDFFVLAEKKRAVVFAIQNDLPVQLRVFETHASILSVMPAANRNQFTLLEDTGKITICEIET